MVEISQEDIDGQILDVVVSVSCFELTDEGHPYVTSRVFRLDVEGDKIEQFLRDLINHDGVVEHTQLVAKE